jgi:uncharacterized protein YprB with RNaseH-like and TPR domain
LEPRDAYARKLARLLAGRAVVTGTGARSTGPAAGADSDEIRRKIESLRLAVLGGAAGSEPERGLASRGRPADLGVVRAAGEPAGAERAVGPEAIDGAREITSPHGRCLVIEKDLRDCPSLEALSQAYRALVTGGEAFGFAFLDLETTGLSATPLFLAGTLVERDGGLKAVQLLARDYSEERCLIDALDGLLGESRICVTFNGKSFDLPYLRERAKYHRLPLRAQPEQLDLLHHARRRWKHELPDCRLLTLEWYILGRRRMGDVGGWEVPCIYHEFVHTKDATRLKGVLRHNLMDVLAMAELLVSLAEAP